MSGAQLPCFNNANSNKPDHEIAKLPRPLLEPIALHHLHRRVFRRRSSPGKHRSLSVQLPYWATKLCYSKLLNLSVIAAFQFHKCIALARATVSFRSQLHGLLLCHFVSTLHSFLDSSTHRRLFTFFSHPRERKTCVAMVYVLLYSRL